MELSRPVPPAEPEINENADAALGRLERLVMCDCGTWAGYGPDSFGKHHHANCPKYSTEKFPYLLYYEEAIDSWTFVPERVENLISVADQLDDGDDMELIFKRKDMTDAEVAAVPTE